VTTATPHESSLIDSSPIGSSPILAVQKVTKRFAGVTALQDVSVSFAAGEVHAVIGENGAGKSTLMKILAGVESPDEGQISFDGSPVTIDSVQAALQARYRIDPPRIELG